MPKRKRFVAQQRKKLEKAREEKKRRSEITQPSADEDIVIAWSSTSRHATPSPPWACALRTSPEKTSAEKRRKFAIIEGKEPADTTFIFIKKKQLQELAGNVLCNVCFMDTIECYFTQHQLATDVKFHCANCGVVAMDTKGDSKTENEGIHRLTVMLVYCMMLLGWWFTGVEKITAYMSLNKFARETYRRYVRDGRPSKVNN